MLSHFRGNYTRNHPLDARGGRKEKRPDGGSSTGDCTPIVPPLDAHCTPTTLPVPFLIPS
jgi:hypothetical protein